MESERKIVLEKMLARERGYQNDSGHAQANHEDGTACDGPQDDAERVQAMVVIKTTTRRKMEVTWQTMRMEVIKLTPKMMVVSRTAPGMMVDVNRQAMRMIGTVTRED